MGENNNNKKRKHHKKLVSNRCRKSSTRKTSKQSGTHFNGKTQGIYYPGVDSGDYIIIVNADKIRVTGNKDKQKIYYRHSGYMGGLKKSSFLEKMKNKKSREILHDAVKGMLPKNRLGRKMIKKLKISQSESHVFASQRPESITL